MRRFLATFLLLGILATGGWALYHKDQIHSPGDFLRLAGEQIDRARGALVPAQSAGWRSGNQSLVRIASFPVQGIDQQRLSNPRVEAVMWQLLSEFDVLALQGVSTEDPWLLKRFLNQLAPNGQLDYVMSLPSDRGPGPATCNAIVFNRATVELDQDRHYTVGDPDGLMTYEPQVAWFRTRSSEDGPAFTFSLVNVRIESPEEIRQLENLFRAVRMDGRGEDDVILVGEFRAPAGELQQSASGGGLTPLIRYVATSTRGDAQSGNILIDSLATSEFNGNSGVFDFLKQCNMTLTEAQQVSDQLPVWAEFSVAEYLGAGRVAREPGGAPAAR